MTRTDGREWTYTYDHSSCDFCGRRRKGGEDYFKVAVIYMRGWMTGCPTCRPRQTTQYQYESARRREAVSA